MSDEQMYDREAAKSRNELTPEFKDKLRDALSAAPLSDQRTAAVINDLISERRELQAANAALEARVAQLMKDNAAYDAVLGTARIELVKQLTAEREKVAVLQSAYDQLTGERFSDRVHAALKFRAKEAEAALVVEREVRARLEADAARYRWLRENTVRFRVEFRPPCPHHDQVDFYIDAAREQPTEGPAT